MTPFHAHARFATLADAGFEGWQLGCESEHERRIVTAVDWPAWAAALVSVSGGLESLADDCDDGELLELLRHGLALVSCGVASREQLASEYAAVMREVLEWGDAIERQLAANN